MKSISLHVHPVVRCSTLVSSSPIIAAIERASQKRKQQRKTVLASDTLTTAPALSATPQQHIWRDGVKAGH